MDKYIKQLKLSSFLMMGLGFLASQILLQDATLKIAFAKSRQWRDKYLLTQSPSVTDWKIDYVRPTSIGKPGHIDSDHVKDESPITALLKTYRADRWKEARLTIDLTMLRDARPGPTTFIFRCDAAQKNAVSSDFSTLKAIAYRQEPSNLDTSVVGESHYSNFELRMRMSGPETKTAVFLAEEMRLRCRAEAEVVGMNSDDPQQVNFALAAKLGQMRVKTPIVDSEVPIFPARRIVAFLSVIEAFMISSALMRLNAALQNNASEVFLLTEPEIEGHDRLDRWAISLGRATYASFLCLVLWGSFLVIGFLRPLSMVGHSWYSVATWWGLEFASTLIALLGTRHLVALSFGKPLTVIVQGAVQRIRSLIAVGITSLATELPI